MSTKETVYRMLGWLAAGIDLALGFGRYGLGGGLLVVGAFFVGAAVLPERCAS